MVRSEETDVAESAELPGLCYGSVPSPGGQRDRGEGRPGRAVKRKGNAHQLRHTHKPQRRQPGTKHFPYFIIPKLSVCLANVTSPPRDWNINKKQQRPRGTERSWHLELSSSWGKACPGCTARAKRTHTAWKASSPHGFAAQATPHFAKGQVQVYYHSW